MHSEARQRCTELRLRVWQDIARGRLPVMFSDEIAAGYGSGRLCAACGEPITDNEAEYEVKDNRDDTRLPFHVSCYFVWQLECAGTSSVGSFAAAGASVFDPLREEPRFQAIERELKFPE